MQDNQLKAFDWIKSGMEYSSGVDLLVQLTRKLTKETTDKRNYRNYRNQTPY